ncbi:MAG: hypothetical protein V4720_12840 [Pseudomonadota bacterium]
MPAKAVPACTFVAEPRSGLLTRWLAAVSATARRTGAAHARRRILEDLPPDLLRDTGLTPEQATGIKRHQPDLPFFMQAGFGDR